MKNLTSHTILFFVCIFGTIGLRAQEPQSAPPDGAVAVAGDREALRPTDDKDASSTAKKRDAECRLCRWVDLQAATVAFRYRWTKSNRPSVPGGEYATTKQTQLQQVYEMDLKLDKKARLKVHTRLSSGDWFISSFPSVEWDGDFSAEKTFKVLPRQFYVSAEPVKGFEVQYGGLGINRGEHTDHTTYDMDGFLTGQRIKIKRPDKAWFDEISITYAYVGDYYKPNFFQRAQRLGKSNYHQFLVSKKIGKRAAFSVDYTSHNSISHLRQAVTVKTPEWKYVKNVKAEFYERLEDFRGVSRGWGYNFQADLSPVKNLDATVGFTKIDYRYNVLTHDPRDARTASLLPSGTLTNDKMVRGMGPFVNVKYKLNKYYSVFGFWTTDVNKPTPLPYVSNSEHFSVGFQLDLRSVLKRTGLL